MMKIVVHLCCDNGLSVIATDVTTDKIVGCFTAFDGEHQFGCCQFLSLACSTINYLRKYPSGLIDIVLIEQIKEPIMKESKDLR